MMSEPEPVWPDRSSSVMKPMRFFFGSGGPEALQISDCRLQIVSGHRQE
jgi:hypothetical protein